MTSVGKPVNACTQADGSVERGVLAGMRDEQANAGRGSIDPVDLARYNRLGAAWWDADGPMGKLHEINPVRLRYIKDIIARHGTAGTPSATAPLGGLTMLDIGCGGGVLSEPLSRLGAAVTGIDPAENNIAVASTHANAAALGIEYRATTAEALAAEGAQFDIVLAMEVVEHVTARAAFMSTVCSLVRPGGLLIASTINRTAKSFLLAIVGAEYVLRWLPRGTHRWQQFVTPDELAATVTASGLTVLGRTGMIYDPLRRDWRLGTDTDVNYFLAARRA